MSFYTSFETPVSIFRPFNTYGPRQSARAIIPTVITQIASGIDQVKVGALHPTRDFNYISDTVEGFISISKSAQPYGQVFNCCSNNEISIADIVKLIAQLMSADIKIETDEIRIRPDKSEVERLLGDNSKLEKLTGFKPMISLKEGLKKTIEWFSKKDNLSKYKTNIYNV